MRRERALRTRMPQEKGSDDLIAARPTYRTPLSSRGLEMLGLRIRSTQGPRMPETVLEGQGGPRRPRTQPGGYRPHSLGSHRTIPSQGQRERKVPKQHGQ